MATGERTWRDDLSLNERLAVGMTLQSAFKKAFPLLDISLIRKRALEVEGAAFMTASCLIHYDQLWHKPLSQREQFANLPPATSAAALPNEAEIPSSPPVAPGIFLNSPPVVPGLFPSSPPIPTGIGLPNYEEIPTSPPVVTDTPPPTEDETYSSPPVATETVLPSIEREPDVITQQVGPYTATYHRSGLFSTILRTQTPSYRSPLALKLTVPSRMSQPHNSRREAHLLTLAAHDYVIPLRSTFEQAGGQFILVFPFMPYTLDDLIILSRFDPRQREWNLESLYDVFSGLSHIHKLGIIHRDIKPSNILLKSPAGPAYLADFGIAWKEGELDSEPKDRKITDVGTTSYRPPELLFGCTTYDQSLDMWAAGCLVAEALEDGKRTLFDAGDFGSELALLQSIFKMLGTPTSELWPATAHLPDWGKMQFYEHPARPWDEVLGSNASPAGQDLVSKLVVYEGSRRLTARQVLNHEFFKSRRNTERRDSWPETELMDLDEDDVPKNKRQTELGYYPMSLSRTMAGE